MSIATRIGCWVVCVAALSCQGAVHAQATSQVRPLATDQLYKSLGAKAGLERLADDFVERLLVDARIGAFFKDVDKAHLKRQLADQFCEVSGGPCTLNGPSMKDVHASMDISKAHFNALVEVLQQSMEAQGIRFADQNRLLAQLAPMHRDIVMPH